MGFWLFSTLLIFSATPVPQSDPSLLRVAGEAENSPSAQCANTRSQAMFADPAAHREVARKRSIDQKRRQIGECLEFKGGKNLLGEITVVRSDMLKMSDGEAQRHSVVTGSRWKDPVLAIERFDGEDRPTYTTFHRADKIEVVAADKSALHAILTEAAGIGRGASILFDYEFYPVAEVRTRPLPAEILETLDMLRGVVGSRGRAYLVEVRDGGRGVGQYPR